MLKEEPPRTKTQPPELGREILTFDVETGNLFFTKDKQFLGEYSNPLKLYVIYRVGIAQKGFKMTASLFPTVSLWNNKESVNANFGADLATHPFDFNLNIYAELKQNL